MIVKVRAINFSASPVSTRSVEPVRAVAQPRSASRIFALDFTKGALVLIMVLYHWMNYFLRIDPSVYRYLRFLTPSFIFITGFLISHVYLPKQLSGQHGLFERLVVRGFKLLAITVVLNVAMNSMHLKAPDAPGVKGWSTGHIISYLLGTKPIAFSVLVPIGYLLILSAFFLLFVKSNKYVFPEISVLLLGCVVFLAVAGVPAGHLELVALGMLGASFGYLPLSRIDNLVKYPVVLAAIYLGYCLSIERWNVIFVLQVVGVCINLAVLYWLGRHLNAHSLVGRVMEELGQYSLFGYIAQLFILNILRRVLRGEADRLEVQLGALAVAALLTIASVDLLRRGRSHFGFIDRSYRIAFS